MAVHELIDLDFSPGIKAENLNYNFQLIYDWLKKERLRVGGWGIVEGFDLSYDSNNFTVTVGKGTIINHDGDEVEIEGQTFAAGDMDYTSVSYTYIVDIDGKITLNDYVYNPNYHKLLTYNPPNNVQTYDEDIVEVLDEDGFAIPITRLVGKFLWVNKKYAGYRLTVNQIITANRTDTIMLHKNGTYEYLWSIDSPSPSHVDLADYDETFCIAVVYWQIDSNGISCDFFTNHRSYRKVFVDQDNVLYLNGEVYKKQKFIYFEEPYIYDREENDLWYNIKDNTLYIWRQTNGQWGWVIVNDHSELIIKERKIWKPEDNPSDLQTFYFDDEEINLRFIPNCNCLDITIDNSSLMSDQYEEITVGEREIAIINNKIEELKQKIENKQSEIELLEVQRHDLNRIIQALRKDLQDSKTLYPEAYDPNNNDYEVRNSDVINLRNLMVIDQRVTKTLEELSDVLSKIHEIEDVIIIYKEELESLEAINVGQYVHRGAGFKLKQPLSHAAYVEVTVTHQVRMRPARETFQRCAMFVRESDITVTTNGADQIFKVNEGYVLGEEQLEIFIDGRKISKGLGEYFEIIDLGLENITGIPIHEYYYGNDEMRDTYAGETSYHFKIKQNLRSGQKVSYRLNRQVWSYDQLDTLVKNIRTYAFDAFEKADSAFETVSELQVNITDTLAEMRSDISIMKKEVAEIKNCYKKGSKISIVDMPDELIASVIGVPIDIVKPANSIRITFEGVSIMKDQDGIIVGGDIFNIYYVTPDSTRILVKEGKERDISTVDYWIERQSANVISVTLRDDLVTSDAYLYMVGFKRGLE